MIRGTTPTLNFTLPFEVESLKSFYITFSQNHSELFTIEKDQCAFENDTITVTLSQSQTLMFAANSDLEIQIRAVTIADEVIASDIIRCFTERILKDGEI